MLQSADASEPALAARRKVAWGFVSGHSKGHAATQLPKALLTVATGIRAKTKAQSNQAFGFDERIGHRFVVMRAWQVEAWCKCQTCLKVLWKLTLDCLGAQNARPENMFKVPAFALLLQAAPAARLRATIQ